MDSYYVELALEMYHSAIGDLMKAAGYMARAHDMEPDIRHAEDVVQSLHDRSGLMVAYLRDGIAEPKP